MEDGGPSASSHTAAASNAPDVTPLPQHKFEPSKMSESRKSTFDIACENFKAGTATPPASMLIGQRRHSIELNDYFVSGNSSGAPDGG